MESKDELTGKLARLPDNQLVKVETVHSDGYASVRRVDGPREDTLAVCHQENLQPASRKA